MIDYSQYEFSFGTESGEVLAVEPIDDNGTRLLSILDPSGCMITSVYFTSTDWFELMSELSGRYIEGWANCQPTVIRPE